MKKQQRMEAYPDPHKPQNKPWEMQKHGTAQEFDEMYKLQNKNLADQYGRAQFMRELQDTKYYPGHQEISQKSIKYDLQLYNRKKTEGPQESTEIKQCFEWGLDDPRPNDYLKNKSRSKSNKIRKAETHLVSESHDNYRPPEKHTIPRPYQSLKKVNSQGKVEELDPFMFNYLDSNETDRFKKKLYDMVMEEEMEGRNQSIYKELFTREELKQIIKELDNCTVAGKAVLGARLHKPDPKIQKRWKVEDEGYGSEKKGSYQPVPIKTPQQFMMERIEEKLCKKGFFKYSQQEIEQLRQQEYEIELSRLHEEGARNQSGTQGQKNLMFKEEDAKSTKSVKSSGKRSRPKSQQKQLSKEEKRNRDQRVKELKLTSRQLPDSAMTTYFGKPAFHAYGNGNTKPTVGGLCYGQFMRTHNINPQSSDNCPEYAQVYARAMLGPTCHFKKDPASPKKRGTISSPKNKDRYPQPPRQPKIRESAFKDYLKLVEQQKARNPIMPEKFRDQQEPLVIYTPEILLDQKIAIEFKLREKKLQEERAMAKQSHRSHRTSQYSAGRKSVTISDGRHLLDPNNQSVAAQSQRSQRSIQGAQQRTEEDEIVALQQNASFQRSADESIVQGEVQNSNRDAQSNIEVTTIPYCPVHQGLKAPVEGSNAEMATSGDVLHLLDPKNYKFLPPQYTRMIQSAGRKTSKSDQVGSLITGC